MVAAATAVIGAIGSSTAAIAATVGAVATTVGTFQQMRAANRAAAYNEQIALRDATVQQQNRVMALRTSQIDAEDKRRETQRTLASIRNSYGVSGYVLSGTPLEMLQDNAIEGEIDAQRIEQEGRATARDIGLGVTRSQETATMERNSISSARTFLATASTAASGTGRVLERVA